jgi:hypothetical protein
MAITPRSRGLSNIGNIVNRQGMASPTRPMPQPMARPVAQPVTGGRTTMAQRQAMTPFRNNLKAPMPMPKINPMTYGPNLAQQGMTPPPPPVSLPDADANGNTGFGGGKSNSGLFAAGGGIGNMAVNAVNQGLQNTFGGQPGMIMDMVERDQYGNPIGGEYSPSPQPFNPNPNPVSNMGGGGMPQQQYNQYTNAAFGGGKSTGY